MIKDLLVYLNGEAEDEVRLAHAEQIAEAHNAYLTGLYCNLIPEMLLTGDPGIAAAQVSVDLQNEAIAAGGPVEEKLRARLDRLGVNHELRRLDLYAGQAGEAVAAEARCADLFVTTRPYGASASQPVLMETVLFASGRGCLLVPPGGKPVVADTVLVAWRNTREAARALSEALPLMRAARNVIVASVVEDEGPDDDSGMPGADVARHLDRHGVNVDLRQISGWSDPAEALLDAAAQSGAGMIVMGGYGHSRFREWVLGGVTRRILSTAEVPVLLAH